MRGWTWKRFAMITGVGVLAGLISYATWQGIVALDAWNDIERVEFDTEEARERLPDTAPVEDVEPPTGVNWDALYDGVLVIGSDERPDEEAVRQERVFADAVLLYLDPASDGVDPVLVSFPRDLLIRDPCTGEESKLDRLFLGCGEVSGPELVALAVEDHTGVGIEHYAAFGFEGFMAVVDALGGVEICVDRPLRQSPTQALPEGCSVAGGETALWYVRSRTLQEQVDGEWQFIEGISDVDRARRQQDFLFAVLSRVRQMQSPTSLTRLAQELDELFVISESFTIPQAVGMAWELRDTSPGRINRLIVPTESFVTEDGEFVRRATAEFGELMEDL